MSRQYHSGQQSHGSGASYGRPPPRYNSGGQRRQAPPNASYHRERTDDRNHDRDRYHRHDHGSHCSDSCTYNRRRDSRDDIRHSSEPPRKAEFDNVASCGHLLQVLGSHEFESRTDLPFERVLGAQAPRTKYRRRRGETKTVIHWGQRKLLLSEVEFLTKYARSGTTVVYAGAAPGTHTSFLIRLFPHVSFVLVDPAPFSRRLCESERVHLRQELFTDAIAAEFAGQSDILFVSDVRSCDWQLLSDSEVEKQVEDDMAAQMRWHDIIKPRHSMLKFRLSWNAGETEYLDGEIFLPIWGPITTTEARLITPENSTARRMWVNTTYEEQMFHFLRWALIRLVSAPMSASAGDTSVVESSICLRLCKLLRGQCSGGCSSGGFFGL
eukprot:m.221305 g.221305  ORF g.221305 m.221305 type:complete len:382 (+) comp10805_c2_seq15:473-1618(+)